MTEHRPYWNEAAETLSRDSLRALQQERLLQRLPHAYARAALVRDTWDAAKLHPRDIRSIDDFLAAAPTLEKDAVRQYRDRSGDPFGGMAVNLDESYTIHSSSGTTGSPTLLPINDRDTSLFAESFARHFWCAGLRPGDTFSLAGGLYLRPLQSLYAGARRIGARVVMTDWVDPTRILHMFRTVKPKVHAFLTPPMVVEFRELLQAAGESAQTVFGETRSFIWGGDVLTPRTRGLITESWGTDVFELSGTADLCYMMMECEAHAGLHAHDDLWLVEVVEPGTTEPVAEGERGEFLFTSLMDSSLAFIRWRSEDVGYLTTERCTCGRTSTRMNFLGRVGYRATVRNKMIFPLDIQLVLETLPETDHGLFQIIKTGENMDVLRLRVGYRPAELADPTPLGERIASALEARLQLPAAVEFVNADELLALGPPHKIPRIHEEQG